MTPGLFNIPFYSGASWGFSFAFFGDNGSSPLDITGLGPFSLVVSSTSGGVILRVESTGPYDSTGVINFAITKTQSRTLPIGNVTVGVSDINNSPYMYGQTTVYKFPS